jgi:hypothetical protein
MTTRQRFNINSAAAQTNQVLRQPLTSPPAATFGTKHHRPGRPNNTTDHQKQIFFFFFFPPEGVPVSLKQEQKTAIEIYKGTARVG